ncbi:hypothetical protein [Cyanobium sp. Morenito 9A2]|uniref:hypothetical protein n=1 Tax=Cyanobium sp. Morenito 9A2 TaxID=2823718 RepID=UPI0020CCD854|nr:hypothetical protein [Cyanobium sp. Morenito 9A2]MCP9848603.1 hypothetical protein [Cyanobium sp. Morenito 9A2]
MEPALLDQERLSRRGGSGLTAADLIGCWRLDQVWPRRGTQPSGLNSRLFRGLGAQLEIMATDSPGDSTESQLRVRNSVRLGGLALQFEGPARLQGRRPLLVFRFERLHLQLGPWRALDRTLPVSEPFEAAPVGRLPFFALIGLQDKGATLCARGRGGGLAQWRRSPISPLARVRHDTPEP